MPTFKHFGKSLKNKQMKLLFNTIMLEINRWTEHHKITIPLIELLESLKKADFNNLEIWQYHISWLSLDEVKKLKSKMNSLNMSAPVIGAYVKLHLENNEAEEMDNLIDHLISSANILGASIFKILPGFIPSNKLNKKTWEQSVQKIKELADKLKANNIQLSLETHPNTMCDSKESTFRLLNDLSGVDNIGLCYQPYDEQSTEEAMQTFSEMLSHIIHIHLQNLPNANAETTTFLETGNWMDYKKLLPHMLKSAKNKIFSLEFTEGIFPPESENFDPQIVINNAVKDRVFFNKMAEKS